MKISQIMRNISIAFWKEGEGDWKSLNLFSNFIHFLASV